MYNYIENKTGVITSRGFVYTFETLRQHLSGFQGRPLEDELTLVNRAGIISAHYQNGDLLFSRLNETFDPSEKLPYAVLLKPTVPFELVCKNIAFDGATKNILDGGYLVASITGSGRLEYCIYIVAEEKFVCDSYGCIRFSKGATIQYLWHKLGPSWSLEYIELLKKYEEKKDFSKPVKPKKLIANGVNNTGVLSKVMANPFMAGGFSINRKNDVIYNIIQKSRYFKALEAKPARGLAALAFKVLSENDENHGFDFSFAEIILAFQMFHSEKIMAVLCLYSKDRGVGKSTLASLVGLLYDNNVVQVINTADAQLLQWGDSRDSKRTVIFDDVPSDSRIVSQLTKMLKSDATQFSIQSINIKGGRIKQTNAFNQIVTTNFIEAIPLEEEDDRRVYPVHLDVSCYENDELFRLKHEVPVLTKHGCKSAVFQDMLNHLKYVYEETVANPSILNTLNKRVPLSAFKQEVTRLKRPLHQQFTTIIENSTSLLNMFEELDKHLVYGDSSKSLGFMRDSELVKLYRVRGMQYMLISTRGLVHVASFIEGYEGGYTNSDSSESIAKWLFNGAEYKQYKVENKNIRAVRLSLRNWRTI